MTLILLYILVVLGNFQSINSLPKHLNELRRVKRITNGDIATSGNKNIKVFKANAKFSTFRTISVHSFISICGLQ